MRRAGGGRERVARKGETGDERVERVRREIVRAGMERRSATQGGSESRTSASRRLRGVRPPVGPPDSLERGFPT